VEAVSKYAGGGRLRAGYGRALGLYDERLKARLASKILLANPALRLHANLQLVAMEQAQTGLGQKAFSEHPSPSFCLESRQAEPLLVAWPHAL